MYLIFEKGTMEEKLKKVNILDNIRYYIELKSLEGIFFSYESIAILRKFKTSECSTLFSIDEETGKIKKESFAFNDKENHKAINEGYSFAEFDESRFYNLNDYESHELEHKIKEQNEKKDWVKYFIAEKDLLKIDYYKDKNVKKHLEDVLIKLDCLPDKYL